MSHKLVTALVILVRDQMSTAMLIFLSLDLKASIFGIPENLQFK